MIVDLFWNIYKIKNPLLKVIGFYRLKQPIITQFVKNTITIIIKDSYKLIPMPLRDFGKCFNLDCHKEVMPYGVYIHIKMLTLVPVVFRMP